MAVFFYSGVVGECPDMDRCLRDKVNGHQGDVIYVPAVQTGFEYEAELLFDFIAPSQPHRHKIFFPETDITVEQGRALLDSSVLFLGGGNTYYLVRHLMDSGMADVVAQRFLMGGVICGHSAGGIVLTPSIHTAGYPEFDRDDNIDGWRGTKGIGVVQFEFFPHYTNRPRYVRALKRLSRTRKNVLLACTDTAGVAVSPNSVVYFGDVWSFCDGQRAKLSPMWKLPAVL